MPTVLLAFLGVIAGADLLLTAAFLPRAERTRIRSAWIVGATAALQAAQVARVHLFVPAVAVYAVVSLRSRRPLLGRTWIIMLPSLLLASTALFGPLVNNRATGVQLALLAGAAAAIAGTSTQADRLVMTRGFLWVSTIGATLAIAQYIHVLPLVSFHGEARPTGFIYAEPDFLCVYAAVGVVIALRTVERRQWSIVIAALNAFAVLTGAARAAWFGLALAVFLTLVFRRNQGPVERKAAATLAALAAVLAIVVTADGSLRTFVVQRAQTAVSGQTVGATTAGAGGGLVSVQARRNQIASLKELAQDAPWYGQGLSASGRVLVYGGIDLNKAPNNLGSNWFYSWWAEGKLLAIPLIFLFICLAFWRMRHLSGALLALVLVNNLFTNTSLQPITWFLVGLAAGQTPCDKRTAAHDPVGAETTRRRAADRASSRHTPRSSPSMS